MKSKSILLVGGDLSGGGGVNRVIRDLSSIFSEKLGLKTTVISARSGATPSYDFPASVAIEFHPEGKRALTYLRILWRMRDQYDYVVSLWPQDNIALAVLFFRSRSKLILCEHISWHFPPAPIRLLRWMCYRLAWRVVVLNDAELEHYSYLRRVRLLPNAAPERPARKLVAREKLILAVGHLEKLKNFEDAVRAMASSGLEQAGWRLVIIGQGSERERLADLIAELGLKRTKIVEPTDDIGSWYARATLMMVTSRLEVFSLVLVEAIQAGVVPVAYAADGPAFILKEFPDHLVQIGDVSALARKLAFYAHSPDLSDRSIEIRASVRERFSVDRIAEQWKELLA